MSCVVCKCAFSCDHVLLFTLFKHLSLHETENAIERDLENLRLGKYIDFCIKQEHLVFSSLNVRQFPCEQGGSVSSV